MQETPRQFSGPLSNVEQRFGDLVASFVRANPHPHAVRLCKTWASAWGNLEPNDVYPFQPGEREFETRTRRAYFRQQYYARRTERLAALKRRRELFGRSDRPPKIQ